MNNYVESLLEDDHASLGQLLSELDAELAQPNIARAFEFASHRNRTNSVH